MSICLRPFAYPNEEERRQIKSLASEVFNGRFSEELYREYAHWLPWITDIFLPIVDSEHGDFRFLPFEGSVMDYDYSDQKEAVDRTGGNQLSDRRKSHYRYVFASVSNN